MANSEWFLGRTLKFGRAKEMRTLRLAGKEVYRLLIIVPYKCMTTSKC